MFPSPGLIAATGWTDMPSGDGPENPDELARARQQLCELQSELLRLRELQQETAKALRRLVSEQRRFDDRLIAVEHGMLFRALRRAGGPLLRWLRSARGIPDAGALYRRWLAGNPPPAAGQPLACPPAITVLISAGGPQQDLDRTIASLRNQSYGNWRACVAGTERLEAPAGDSRISAGAATFDEAVQAARQSGGDYVLLMQAGDLLAPSALGEIARVAEDRSADVVYTDEDAILPDGRRHSPVFKPDWSPDLLARSMYLGRALAISRASLAGIGWFRSEYGTAQEYDAVLRLAENGARFRHVPQVLYHRANPVSTEDHEAGRRALAAAVGRRGWDAAVSGGPFPLGYRLLRRPAGAPLASIIICSRMPDLLRCALRNLERRTAYRNYEIVTVEHGLDPQRPVASPRGTPITRVHYEGPFNYSRMNNRGAEAARGAILVFLNDDIEPLDPHWLDCLVAEAQRPEIGAAGMLLLYPSGTIQHAGVAIGLQDGAAHPGRRMMDAPFWKWLRLTRNVSAVTGAAMAVRRAVFEEAGRLDEAFPENYNDVDFCLRVRAAGYEVVCVAEAALRHYEAQSRQAIVRYRERERFTGRWQTVLEAGDPFYNPNLTRDGEDLTLRGSDTDGLMLEVGVEPTCPLKGAGF
jgi:GT2 family glycosyltransferase